MWFIRLWRTISSRAAMSGWRVLSSSIAVSTAGSTSRVPPRPIHLDFVVCVTAPVPVRIQRIMQRDHIPAEKAQQWIDAVMPQEELAARSDFEIVNDGEQDIDAQVRKLLDIINNKE